jgi:aspartate aminotransferase-like enzyme
MARSREQRQFRFTPPTHALLAFSQALRELRDEGGVAGRAQRYRANRAALLPAMQALGFAEYLRADRQSDIITSYRYPADERFVFDDFYRELAAKGFVIYPGKVSHAIASASARSAGSSPPTSKRSSPRLPLLCREADAARLTITARENRARS